MKFEHVFVVGAGGIGTHLLEPLARLLAFHEEGTKNITVIDGDTYEAKNQTRQLFPAKFIDTNKAEAITQHLQESIGFSIRSIAKYVDSEKFADILQNTVNEEDMILVITAVDNHATRKAIIDALDRKYPNFVFLSGSNGYHNGQVLAYVKAGGELGTAHPYDKYEDLKYPADHIPETGCQDEAPSDPQLITANATAATGLLWTVQAMLDNEYWFEELHFDIRRNKLVPFQETEIKLPSKEAMQAALKAKKAAPVVETPNELSSQFLEILGG